MSPLKACYLACCVAVVVLSNADAARAQYTGRADSPYGPTTSPYLNLLQNNNQLNTVSAYNTLVKPILDQNASLNRQGTSINRLQNQVNSGAGGGGGGGGGAGGRSTGHSSYFMNYSHYYPRMR
jgi:hypothetical protein